MDIKTKARKVAEIRAKIAMSALLQILDALPLAKEAKRLRQIAESEVVRRPTSDARRGRSVAA